MEEVFRDYPDTAVPEADEIATDEEWQEIEQSPALFEELRRAFGLHPKDDGTEPSQEPVVMPPIPSYEYPAPPVARSSPGDSQAKPKPVQVQPYQRPPTKPKPIIQSTPPKASVPEQPVQQVSMSHPETVQLPPEQEVQRYTKPVENQRFEDPRQISKSPDDSKKDFDTPKESKKDFEPPPISKKKFEPDADIEDDAPVFDRDNDEGRWRSDDQVKELVIYRWEFKRWPEDVEDTSSKETRTGLESYYELRYFKEGTNRKGERYSELYGKHRAKRDLWIDEACKQRAGSLAQLDTPTPESNVVHFSTRRAHSVG